MTKPFFKSTFLLSLLFLISQSLFAQADKELIKTLDDYYAQAQKDWNVPGMSVGLIIDGEVVLSKGYGTLKKGEKNQPNGESLFAIASNTKAFIAAAIGILVEEGKLDWDDKVIDYVPYFRMYDEYVTQHATIRDLLCHRIGLGTFSGDEVWYKSDYTAEEAIKRAAQLEPAYEFRSGYGYSNLMFFVAGEVIKKVSGMSWDAFIKERIMNPIGMHRTVTSTRHLKGLNNVAQPHKPDYEGIGNNTPIPWTNWDNMGAAGGIISSTDDMLKWAMLQINGGQHGDQTIFSTSTQTEFWKPHNNFTVRESTREYFPYRHVSAYALGWSVSDYNGTMVYAHGGGYDGMYSRVVVVPEKKFAMIVLTNSQKSISGSLSYYTIETVFDGKAKRNWSEEGMRNEMNFRARRKKAITDREEKRIENTTPTHDLEAYTGTFEDPLFGQIEVLAKDGQLALNFPNHQPLNANLSHWHKDVFKIEWNEIHAWFDFGTIQFVLDNNAEVTGIEFDVPNDDIFYNEIHAKKVEE